MSLKTGTKYWLSICLRERGEGVSESGWEKTMEVITFHISVLPHPIRVNISDLVTGKSLLVMSVCV